MDHGMKTKNKPDKICHDNIHYQKNKMSTSVHSKYAYSWTNQDKILSAKLRPKANMIETS